ncbi:hypothetical protein [Patulibacter defluvii]|uniref:hypothetical protein n=1 Tax=Patulibacter defluvii TaxID=3095358 RepID=UPI002A762232|nr:hypothetical protein [Patulibacter sp. DM4]
MGALARTPRTPVIAVAAAVLVVALLSLILPSTATYDPWAWIVWGREAFHGDLVTDTGPSWKPLPVVVTTLATPLGSSAPDVWVVVGRAGALAAPLIAFALARRYGGLIAGLVASLPLALEPWWFRHGWLANSEGLLVAAVLGAVLAELTGHRRWALAAGLAAALLRPEAWPFLLLWAAWLAWRAGWGGRLRLAALLAVIPVAWLVPEKLGSGDFWRAATRAQNPDPGAAALTSHPALTVLDDYARMLPWPVWIGLAAAIALVALRRRGRADTTAAVDAPAPGEPSPLLAATAIGGFGLAWAVLVALMTQAGYSGNSRYLIPAVALLLVATAIAVGRLWPLLPSPAQWLVGLALVAVTVGPAIHDIPDDAHKVMVESRLMEALPEAVAAAGGAEFLRRCGPAYTNRYFVPQIAWELDEHARDVGYLDARAPAVLFRPNQFYGWAREPQARSVAGLRTLVRTRWWQIEVACRPGVEVPR